MGKNYHPPIGKTMWWTRGSVECKVVDYNPQFKGVVGVEIDGKRTGVLISELKELETDKANS